jgi:putative transposase
MVSQQCHALTWEMQDEAIRKWCRKFGQSYANQLRRRHPRPGDKWHLDEVFLTINGARYYLWRAVDQDGHVLDILVQRRRDKKAAKTFFRKLLKGCQYVPRVIITDKLKSYEAAKREILPSVEHRQHRYLNNRAENSPQPTRQRERRMQGCKSPGHAQRFLSAYGPIAQHFRPRRHRSSATEYRQEMRQRFDSWRDITNLPTAASG